MKFVKLLKSQKYDMYVYSEEICQYISKKYYVFFSIKKEKDADYEDLLFKYISNSKYIFLKK